MQKINGENDCNQSIEKDVSSIWSKKTQDIKRQRKNQQSVIPSNLTQLPLESIHKPDIKEGFETDEQQKMISGSFDTTKSSNTMNAVTENVKKISNYIAKIAGYPMKTINSMTMTISKLLCKILSKKSTDKDIELVKSRFKILLSILVSYYIIYNWYFVMFFKDSGLRIPVIDLSMKRLMEIKPLNYLFKYILCVVSSVDWVLVSKYPIIMKDNTPQLNLVLLLLIIIYVVSTMGEDIIGDFATYLNMGKTGYTGTFIAFSVFYGVYSFIQELSNEIVGEPSLMSLISTYFLVSHYRNFGILHVIAYILRIIWSTIIHYLWGLLVVVYVLIMSFFAIFIYSENSLFDTIKRINIFMTENIIIKDQMYENVDSQNPRFHKEDTMVNSAGKLVLSGMDTLNELDPSGKTGKLSKLISTSSKMKSLFESLINIIYQYVFELIIIISLFYTMIMYGTNINDIELKSGLISLNFLFILLVAGYIHHKYTEMKKLMVLSSADG